MSMATDRGLALKHSSEEINPRDQRASKKQRERSVHSGLLQAMKNQVMGVCTHKSCIEKAQISGLNAKFILLGKDRDHSNGAQHASYRQFFSLYCGCETVMAWAPDAVTYHFLDNHFDFIEKLKLENIMSFGVQFCFFYHFWLCAIISITL